MLNLIYQQHENISNYLQTYHFSLYLFPFKLEQIYVSNTSMKSKIKKLTEAFDKTTAAIFELIIDLLVNPVVVATYWSVVE